jgi:hypothetical protein
MSLFDDPSFQRPSVLPIVNKKDNLDQQTQRLNHQENLVYMTIIGAGQTSAQVPNGYWVRFAVSFTNSRDLAMVTSIDTTLYVDSVTSANIIWPWTKDSTAVSVDDDGIVATLNYNIIAPTSSLVDRTDGDTTLTRGQQQWIMAIQNNSGVAKDFFILTRARFIINRG